jgi:hypothetical protein
MPWKVERDPEACSPEKPWSVKKKTPTRSSAAS